jgi:hypothetical protein
MNAKDMCLNLELSCLNLTIIQHEYVSFIEW